jgi:DNA topoisomerase-2
MKKTYTKKDPISHILERTDMYCGSKKEREQEEYIAVKNEENEYEMKKELIKFSPAILRIFIEVLSNAIDNVERSKQNKIPCTMIKININKETGETSVWNDGDIIPIEINESEAMYNHSLIFGNLLTGSNYDDEEERLISGRNGVGCKCTNIFSKKFTVRGVDPVNKKILEQTWVNNMRETTGAEVKTTKEKQGYTQVTYYPDFSQFNISGYTEDIINLYTKYIIDASMLSKVKIYLNNELLKVKNLENYGELYNRNASKENLMIKTEDSEVLITASKEHQVISFVNGVYTKLGGVHCDTWIEGIFRPLLEKINKKGKPQLNMKDIKQFFKVFLVCSLPNPEFSSQDKEKLESPKPKNVQIKQSEITKIMKWSIMSDIEEIQHNKDMLIMKKSEKKKKGYVKIEGYDPANFAGTKKSQECSLILCEGLSAKTYAVAGIQKGVYGKEGRNHFGCLPLRGKCLNVRNASPTIISKNAVITDIIQALGLQYNMDYNKEENYNTLSYGKVILLTDADCDGIHIEGLILNFFHYLFPTLLERTPSFLVSMQTPIVRIIRKSGDLLFYDENRYNEYVKTNNMNNVKTKYYKGLGTTKSEDVKDTFGEKMLHYVHDEKTKTTMEKVFHKNFTDERKKWLEEYDPIKSSMSIPEEDAIVNLEMSNFLTHQVIKFSHNDCKRSIPSLFDGLKESQRKVLYAVKKRNLNYSKTSLKVAQLGGYVAEHTNYHHGEQNLYQTITKMANEFPGSNNIPLLYRDGQFGSRISGGMDAANPRYIFTKMDALTPYIYREEDDILLNHVVDDGDEIEPYFYMPIIPMILVNGCSGIGTGWSCNVPSFNPMDLIKCIKIWLKNKDEPLPELIPWYRDFHGTIEKSEENKFITTGICKKIKNKCTVSELPIGLWTDKFKETSEDWLSEKKIKNLQNFSTPQKVNFVLTELEDGMNLSIKTLKLTTTLHTSNMVLFNEKFQLKKYTVHEIIKDFCSLRYEYYTKRKSFILNSLERQLKIVDNKVKFLTKIMEGSLKIMNVDEEIVLSEMINLGFDKVDDSFDYLLKMQIKSFTMNKVNSLKSELSDIKLTIENLEKQTESDLWLEDIRQFIIEYDKWSKSISKLFT